MKILKKSVSKLFIILVIIIGMMNTMQAQTNSDAIIGVWSNEKKDTKFQIYKQSNVFFGKILSGKIDNDKDVKNPNIKLRNREVIGLIMLTNFVFDGDNTWQNGTIYDPREGKTYSCKITLKNKDQINVRGYIGISLFGRSEIWTLIK